MDTFELLTSLCPSVSLMSVKTWFTSRVLPKANDLLNAAAAPLKVKVDGHLGLVRKLVSAAAGSDDMKAACGAIVSLNFAADLSIMAESAIGDLAQGLAEGMRRILEMAQVACALAQLEPLRHTEQHADCIMKLHALLESSAAFIAGYRKRFVGSPRESVLDADVFDAVHRHGREILERALQELLHQVKDKKDLLMQHAPPSSLILNPHICNNKEMQATLFGNPNKRELSSDVVALSDVLHVWAGFRSKGIKAGKEIIDQVEM